MGKIPSALIKAIEKEESSELGGYVNIQKVIVLIQQHTEWISVEDEPENGHYLVWKKHYHPMVLKYFNGVWKDEGNNYYGPTHYSHIPKGPA